MSDAVTVRASDTRHDTVMAKSADSHVIIGHGPLLRTPTSRGERLGMAATREYTADMVRELNDRHDWRWPLYWMVDADAHTVDAWTPEATSPRIERETLIWRPADASVPFMLRLAELFQPI